MSWRLRPDRSHWWPRKRSRESRRWSACTARSPPLNSSFPRSCSARLERLRLALGMTGSGDLLVSVEALAQDLAAGPGPVLLDVRWRLGGPPGIDSYRRGHLPAAVFT